jgi:hypothetical protein
MSIIDIMQFQKERFNRREITAGTIRNYLKSIKLFCQMADIHIPWDKISRGLPRGKRYADDRAPTLEEINRRIKPLIYLLLYNYRSSVFFLVFGVLDEIK